MDFHLPQQLNYLQFLTFFTITYTVNNCEAKHLLRYRKIFISKVHTTKLYLPVFKFL